ncbi:hypothetical protein MKW94_000446 [Papaver nudicaule]|uniref:RRM domain-containing protein n=1 Tax=Papaver nudicaule TaxID=74823 RepID=A0AA41VZS9_PAPNU|nr:hypothetical protein [Papaver nudicaule]
MNESDLIEFFKQTGEVVDARYKNRRSCNGTCFVEFATEEAANKALELDGRYLCNMDIRVGRVGRVESTGASKTLAAKNLSFSATKSDVMEFFKHAGGIVDVRFSLRRNGDFRGNCHIEFATEEAANKAVELNGEYLLGRPVALGFAREIIFVRGFDTSLGFDRTQNSLEELFSTCGKIYWMHIPTYPYTSVPKGIALIEFLISEISPKPLQ